MAITGDMVRKGMQRWAREQAHTLEAIQRALEIVYREQPGRRSVDELAHALLLAVANQHERHLEGALGRLDGALGRLLDDMVELRGAATEGRAPALRDADLHIVADAMAEMSRFEDRVRFMLDHNAGELQSSMHDILNGGHPAPPPTPAPAAVAGAGTPPTRPAAPRASGALDAGRQTLSWADEIEQAWQQGRTLEPAGVPPVRVSWPDHPLLVDQMRRMREATDAYRAVLRGSPSPEALARAADELRQVVADSNELLRSLGRRFETGAAHDRLPPTAAVPAGSSHPAGSPAADALTVRARAGALAGPSATASQLADALHFGELHASATGTLSEPLARTLPGVGQQGYTLGPSDIRRLPTTPAWLAGRLADLVQGWQRAHLIGPGFGGEVFAGLMLAPWGVNQVAQNKGAEHILREMAKGLQARGAGETVTPTVTATGRRLAIPLASGAFEHVDVLSVVRYEIPRPGAAPVHIDIHVQLDGSWRVSHDLPAGVWPADVPLTGPR